MPSGRHSARTRATTIAAAAVVAFLTVFRYRGAVPTFFFLDDFWVLHEGSQLHLGSIAGIAHLFRPGPGGFGLYRPLATAGYSYLLQTLFGYDASAHHAFQLLVFAGAVVVAFAIARRLTGSTTAAAAAALMYTLAPGQAMDVYWLAAFTITGTAFVLLLMMWCWLATTGRRRVVACTLLQAIGIFASEHAIAGPVLLATLAAMRREPWRRAVAAIAPAAAIVAAYVAAKLYYFVYLRPLAAVMILSVYGLTSDPRVWVAHLGEYLVACFTASTLLYPTEATCFRLGAALIVTFALAAWRAHRVDGPWILVAGGIALFAGSLAPVLLERRFGSSYVCVAALGAALTVVGLCDFAGRSGRWLALAVAVAMLVVDRRTGERAWRDTDLFRLVQYGAHEQARWLQAVRKGAGSREVLVPANPNTGALFRMGQVQSFFPEIPPRVTLYDPRRPPVARTDQVLLPTQVAINSADDYPGADPRWRWLRRLTGPEFFRK